MAEIARDYHERLQHNEITSHLREIAGQEMLNYIPEDQKFTKTALNHPLDDLIKESHIHSALYASKTGTSTGLDSIPYEAW